MEFPGAAASCAAVAPHSPTMTDVASDADEMLARAPEWPGHAVAHAALSSCHVEPAAAGRMYLKHFTLPAGRNQPPGHTLLELGVGLTDGEGVLDIEDV